MNSKRIAFLLLAVIGYLGKLTEQAIAAYGKTNHLALPNIEYVLWAIIFGLIVSNTVGVPRLFRPGVATYEFEQLFLQPATQNEASASVAAMNSCLTPPGTCANNTAARRLCATLLTTARFATSKVIGQRG